MVVAKGQVTSPPSLLVTRIDSTSAPDYSLQASVLAPDGSSLPALNANDFALSDSTSSDTPIPILSAKQVNSGVAVMIVADLGGLVLTSERGARNVDNVEQMTRQFLEQYLKPHSNNAQDYAGMIIITGTGDTKFGQVIPPTQDLGEVGNALEYIKSSPVSASTAMFDGLDLAINLLTRSTDQTVQTNLNQRRKIILVFSDGSDDKFSNESIRGDILMRARDSKIAIFCVEVHKRTDKEAANLRALSTQSGGSAILFSESIPKDDNENQVKKLFATIDSQRTQYALTFRTVKPLAKYEAKLQIRTVFGPGESTINYTSNLAAPTIQLIGLEDGKTYAQNQNQPIEAITLTAEIKFPDAKSRAVNVQFYVDGKAIGGPLNQSPYALVWQPSAIQPNILAQTKDYSIYAEITDSYLADKKIASQPVHLQVSVNPLPTPVPSPTPNGSQSAANYAAQNAPLLVGFCGFSLIMLVIVMIVVLSNRSLQGQMQVLRNNINTSGGFTDRVKTVTKRLLGLKPWGELEVIMGPMKGAILPLDSDACWIGRDRNQCTVMINDESVSSTHCRISKDAATGQVMIFDEISANDTYVDQVLVPKNQPQPLPVNSIIKIGNTQLVFKMGRNTQRLGETPKAPSSETL